MTLNATFLKRLRTLDRRFFKFSPLASKFLCPFAHPFSLIPTSNKELVIPLFSKDFPCVGSSGGRNTDFEVYFLVHILTLTSVIATCSWANYLTSLHPSFLICKMGIICSTSQCVCIWNHILCVKSFDTPQALVKASVPRPALISNHFLSLKCNIWQFWNFSLCRS